MAKASKSKKGKNINSFFDKFSNKITNITGSSAAFITALAVIIIWAVSGPIFHYSDTWQLVINTGTTIITFLMVFIIQKSQNKDGKSVQIKLNELLASHKEASNQLLNVEDLSEEELDLLHNYYNKLIEKARQKKSLKKSHSVEEVEQSVGGNKDLHENDEQVNKLDKNKNKKAADSSKKE